MQNPDAQIKILNDSGNAIGTKPRGEIDKRSDILHCADVLVVDAQDRLLLAKIPNGGLHAGMLASSAATMVRDGEQPMEATYRALSRELGVEQAEIHLLGEKFFAFPEDVKRLKTTYWTRVEGSLKLNPNDATELVAFSRLQLEENLIKTPTHFAPTFLSIWKSYCEDIPCA